MSVYRILGAGLLALSLAPVPARAQANNEGRKQGDAPGPIDSLSDLQDTGRMIFKMADTDNDGKLSQQEAINAANHFVGGLFFNADKNGDGVLSAEEAKQAREEFFAQKPWLRYVIETAAGRNPLASLETAFDTNNDKQLQATELRQAVQTTVQGIFATADTNRDNELSTTEVNAALAGLARTAAQAAFQQADTDNNGQISQAEFEKAIVEPARTAFRVMDLNHDGQISQQEAQTARQVVMSKLRMLAIPEAPNSPRHMLNSAVGNQAQPVTAAPSPAPANPAAPR
jgi:Ca2+-binding EF-hand superfamily protein